MMLARRSRMRIIVAIAAMALSCELVPQVYPGQSDAGPSDAGVVTGVGDGGEAGAPDASACAAVACDTPPKTTCEDAMSLRVFDALGTCNDGRCFYSPSTEVCDFGCQNGACLSDLCQGVACTNPPPAECVGQTSVRRWGNGQCQMSDGGASCRYVPVDSPCDGGEQCFDGTCATSTPSCSSASCQGCCDAGVCLPLAMQSTVQCGANGSECQACGSGYECKTGSCVDINECLTANGGCNANATCTNVMGGKTCVCKTGFVGDGLTCVAKPQWRKLTLSNQPDPVVSPMVYDSAQQRLLLNTTGRMYELDSTGWTEAGQRSATWGRHGMAYDPLRSRSVMFGGTITQPAAMGLTQEWTGGQWLSKPNGAIPHREHPQMVFDANRGHVLLFGGRNGNTFFDDLWEWNGQVWTKLQVTGSKPTGRSNAGITYDTDRGRVAMFGGLITNTGANAETWEFDGTKWAQVGLIGPRPSARSHVMMAYDSKLKRVVLFGGALEASFANPICYNDTWTWDGTRWTLDSTLTTRPTPRFAGSGAYDVSRGLFIIGGGGTTFSDTFRETWTYGP